MNWRAYLVDFWGSIIKRKFNMIAISFFVATYFGLVPSVQSLFGILVFLLAYSSIYYYNDLLDFERDKERLFMPREKMLYHGTATPRDYIHLLAWISVLGVALSFIYSPLLGIVAALAILANHVRTITSNLTIREVLLSVVELLNFEAFWIAMYGSLIPGLALPVFVAYSTMYALFHALYKLRSKPLLWAARQWWIQLLAVGVFIAVAFSVPLAASSVVHLAALLFASFVYVSLVGVQAMRYANNVEGGMSKIMRSHDVAILLTAGLLMVLGGAIVYAHLPTAPLPVSTPPEFTALLSQIDHYQFRLLEFASRL